jgi:uncharacterized protein (TIGR02147 family)
VKRPEIFQYHDYRIFLRDWLAFKKAGQSRLSLRTLAKQAGLASGYLPMVLSGKRPLSGAALAKLQPFLGLTASERSFFDNLLVLGTSDSHEARVDALDRMKQFGQFQKLNRQDTDVYEYLTHWYYVAIREMATMPGFKADPEWIQQQLKFSVPLAEVKAALAFLFERGYIEKLADGSIRPPEKALDCSGGVYRVALAKFHREALALAATSIEKTPSAERNIQGYTLALDAKGFEKANEIVEEALKKIRALALEKNGDSVYHMEVALFPMSKGKAKGSAR